MLFPYEYLTHSEMKFYIRTNFIPFSIKRIPHAVDNNILQNLTILQEDVRMAEDIYGPRIPHLKVKKVRRKIQHVDPVKITSVPKTILDK